jgi:hypothetical protein
MSRPHTGSVPQARSLCRAVSQVLVVVRLRFRIRAVDRATAVATLVPERTAARRVPALPTGAVSVMRRAAQPASPLSVEHAADDGDDPQTGSVQLHGSGNRLGTVRSARHRFPSSAGARSELLERLPLRSAQGRGTAPCLDHALSDPTLAGIWAGATERVRRTLRAPRAVLGLR